MSIKNEKIVGKLVYVSMISTSLKSASYDTNNENLRIMFNNGKIYEYKNVPYKTFTKFCSSKSQGKFFNENILKNYKFKKVKSI